MEKARNDLRLKPLDSGFDESMGITLADKGWTAYSEARMPRRSTGAGEGRRRQLAQRPAPSASPSNPESSWRAADRALAEIAAANRAEPFATGRDRDRAVLERATAAVRDSLLEAAQAAAEASRRARQLAETLDEALTALNLSQNQNQIQNQGQGQDQSARAAAAPALASGTPRPTSPEAGSLSQREREVLSRVAKGRSNKAIAEELYVSPNTVKTHVSSLLRKLDVHSRAQLATIAVQQGL